MPIPPEPVLRAAVRWLERLPPSGVARCRAIFTTHREFSDITPTQYEAAYAWLQASGLLEALYSDIPPSQRVYVAAVSSGTQWLRDADMLIRSPEELPEDAIRAADALHIGADEAYAHITTAWGKVDTTERERIGEAGEYELARLLSENVDAQVDHVAVVADGFGYDIAITAPGYSLLLEVKATLRRRRAVVYLSRNEYQTMRREPTWRLIAVRLTDDLSIAAVATVPRDWISAEVPTDRGHNGRWESCRLNVPLEALHPGVDGLHQVLRPDISALLAGAIAWPGDDAARFS